MIKCTTIKALASIGLFLSIFILLAGEPVAEVFQPIAFEKKEFLEVKVYQVIIDPTSQQPVVFLADPMKERALPIWVGPYEANAILSEIEGRDHERPLTHDLLGRIIRKTNRNINKIFITHLAEGIYYAKIEMEKGSSSIEIDARPSDSIVMALKFKAPIFVSKRLFSDMAVSLKEKKDIDESYGLTIQDLTPSLIRSFSLETTYGVLISDVRLGSQAEMDGIERGDIFVEIGGRSVRNVKDMKDALLNSKTAIQAKIFRRAQYLSITIHLN